MSSIYSEAQRAAGKINIAIQRLADRYPFHCKVLEQFKIHERPSVGTIAVMVGDNNLSLVYNSAFVLGTPMAELVGVLLHEVHHVVFGHVCADPADYADRWARVVAEEVTANEFIKEPLPDGAILLEEFPSLSPLQSTQERYDILKTETVRQPLGDDQGSNGTLDNHMVWEKGQQDSETPKATIESVLHDVVLEVGPDRVPSELKDALGKIGIGNTAGGGQYDVHGGRRGRLDWRRLLRRYAGQILQVRAVFNRPSRRFPDLVGIVPGKCRQTGRPRVMAIIDTSGSITPELLELISAELGLLARHYEVIVVECDAQIHSVHQYRAPLTSVHGSGGTDLRPPLASEFLQEHRPDLIVFFTDGGGPAPERAPRVPLIWCLVPGGQRPADWGRMIQMGSESKS